jgi:1-acyl-sn-glycerol-3-phosphate acyltransferase
VADAEIIPLGTRGRPGRGSGSAKPSASARNLAGGGKKTAPKQPTAKKGAAKSDPEDTSSTKAAPQPEAPATTKRPPRQPVPEQPVADRRRSGTPHGDTFLRTPATGRPASSSTTTRDRPPGDGIPVADWLHAFTTAAKEIFGDSWEPRLAEFLAFLRRRITGDYTVDEYGFDAEITERFFYAAIRPIADKWFRVEVRGADNIPAEGGALVVSNHSGTVPVDGLVTGVSIHDHTGRHLRPLGADLVFRLPIVGEVARKGGATLACNEDAERMLRGGELVGVWPEGFKGIGKPYSDRYKLQRFGRGGFVSAALRTGVPIVPCSVVGAEEIYPLVGNLPSLARLLGVPYIPITPLFPLLGPLGLVPLPSKWIIEFGEPIRTDSYDDGAADDPMLVFNVTDQVRETIQQTLYSLLMQRRSVFY